MSKIQPDTVTLTLRCVGQRWVIEGRAVHGASGQQVGSSTRRWAAPEDRGVLDPEVLYAMVRGAAFELEELQAVLPFT